MGYIYIVYDVEWREAFAVKTYQYKLQTKHAQEQFKNEANIWINLDRHENIAWARFVENIHNRPYLFIEYVSGGDLSRWIGTKKLDLKQALQFAIQFCSGMEHAFTKGLKVHRDIKPQNCLITEDNILKITDFGLAKNITNIDITRETNEYKREFLTSTQTGQWLGTLPYMAPEQFNDAKNVDIRADIYSFGIMLFEMICGYRPYEGKSYIEFRQKHQESPIPKLPSFSTPQKSPLLAIIQRCLAKKPEQRYHDFRQLLSELRDSFAEMYNEKVTQKNVSKNLSIYDIFNKATSLLKLEKYVEAITFFNEFIKLNPDSASAWCHKGIALGSLGKIEQAFHCYDRALEINNNFAVAWLNKGIELEKLNRYEEAFSCYTHAHEFDSRLALAFSNKGSLLGKMGRMDEAISNVNRAIEIDKYCIDAWFNKGNLLANTGNFIEAIECCNRVLQIDSLYINAWCTKGAAFLKLKNYHKSIYCSDQALALNPKNTVAWCNKGNALNKIGRNDDAVTCFNNAIRNDPENFTAWYNKGNTFFSMEQYDDALECLEKAITLNPQYANAWYNKGMVLIALGKTKDALECFLESKRLGNIFADEGIEYCKQISDIFG